MKVAVPFYSEENFAKMKALLPMEGWPAFYDDWLEETERREKAVTISGNVPVRIEVEPVSLEEWCKTKDRPLTRPSILNYCMVVLETQHGRATHK